MAQTTTRERESNDERKWLVPFQAKAPTSEPIRGRFLGYYVKRLAWNSLNTSMRAPRDKSSNRRTVTNDINRMASVLFSFESGRRPHFWVLHTILVGCAVKELGSHYSWNSFDWFLPMYSEKLPADALLTVVFWGISLKDEMKNSFGYFLRQIIGVEVSYSSPYLRFDGPP